MFQSHKYQAIKHTFHPSYIATQSIPSASIVIPSGNYMFRSQNSTFLKDYDKTGCSRFKILLSTKLMLQLLSKINEQVSRRDRMLSNKNRDGPYSVKKNCSSVNSDSCNIQLINKWNCMPVVLEELASNVAPSAPHFHGRSNFKSCVQVCSI